ncbi:MAG: aromatic-ring-hydroxylating dioxygenase subunit beta [Reyranella sp.]|jgi:p-cumate 2,3-dioxygenase beta subunit|uniref:aromatic-ring-hydroxylating dioxygenase subunit beta n=1 Tax=Reyranella sp. TaxID=1929291 RepID=UPI0027313028|nr:aromatic-ring-hydroxylating dioxygenase subunit beta [Reyranella sp.]MDP1963085.1 aromatic-ring-hydroxylating dioxygenase subunit beta [Reyranella sp.]MDP2378765.1 aromatic-ring-hydroxylating dioxygenase subunit beta [Reyranella sp.]
MATQDLRAVPAPAADPVTRAEVEDFLINEAALLDEWKLEEWLTLVADDGRYLVPSLDSPDSDHRTALFLISDDRRNLGSRVKQLLSRTTWAEFPRSRTRRLVSNVRILERTGDQVKVTANFAVWRFQHDATDCYVGRYVHLLVRSPDGGLLFRERRAILDLESLRPHGKVSFIL